LKRILEVRKSPLLGILLNFACAVLKEYKEEIEEILVADNTFAKEVLFEIQHAKSSRQPLLCRENKSLPNSPILQGNTFATPIAPQTGTKSPLPVGTTSKTPLAIEVLQEEGMMTAKSVKHNWSGENPDVRKSQASQEKHKEEDISADKSNTEVRRLSSLFNAAAD